MPQTEAVITLDASVPLPPYLQIFEQIRALIERGDVRPGDALPPVRQLAGDLGIAANTVARAYADLKAEGWITSEKRQVTRVASGSPALARATRGRALGEAVGHFLASLASRGYAEGEVATELRKRLPALEG